MNAKNFLYRFAAVLIAWALLLLTTEFLTSAFASILQLASSVWILIGLGVLLASKINFPVPSTEYLDVLCAFQLLWCAACWPVHLMRK